MGRQASRPRPGRWILRQRAAFTVPTSAVSIRTDIIPLLFIRTPCIRRPTTHFTIPIGSGNQPHTKKIYLSIVIYICIMMYQQRASMIITTLNKLYWRISDKYQGLHSGNSGGCGHHIMAGLPKPVNETDRLVLSALLKVEVSSV